MEGRTENSAEAEAAVGEKQRLIGTLQSEINALKKQLPKEESKSTTAGMKKQPITKEVKEGAITFAKKAVEAKASKEDIEKIKIQITKKDGEEAAHLFQNEVNNLQQKEKTKNDVPTVPEPRTETREEVPEVRSEESRVDDAPLPTDEDAPVELDEAGVEQKAPSNVKDESDINLLLEKFPDLEITIKAYDEAGNKIVTEYNAKDVLDALNDDINKLNKLLDCVKS